MTAETEKRPNVSDNTAFRIRDLDDAIDLVKKSPTPGHVRRRLAHMYRIGVELKQQSDLLIQNLTKGEVWLQSNEGHAKYRGREDQWLQWLADFEAIEDALQRAEEVGR